MTDTLDVCAIKDSCTKELCTALDKIKNDNDLCLFTNASCHLRIGSQDFVDNHYNSFLLSTKDEVLIMLNSDNLQCFSTLINYLDRYNLHYTEIGFAKANLTMTTGRPIELIFANNLSALKKATIECVQQGAQGATYYPNANGKLEISYPVGDEAIFPIDISNFMGIIVTEEQIIVLTNQKEPSLSIKKVTQALKNSGLSVSIEMGKEPFCDNSEKVVYQKVIA